MFPSRSCIFFRCCICVATVDDLVVLDVALLLFLSLLVGVFVVIQLWSVLLLFIIRYFLLSVACTRCLPRQSCAVCLFAERLISSLSSRIRLSWSTWYKVDKRISNEWAVVVLFNHYAILGDFFLVDAMKEGSLY